MFFINDEIINNHLKNIYDYYFDNYSVYKGHSIINGIPSNILGDLIRFLIKKYKQDISFDYLYDEYAKTYLKKYEKNNLIILDKNSFEKQLKSLKLNTYIAEDENHNICKYVCFENEFRDI